MLEARLERPQPGEERDGERRSEHCRPDPGRAFAASGVEGEANADIDARRQRTPLERATGPRALARRGRLRLRDLDTPRGEQAERTDADDDGHRADNQDQRVAGEA